MYAIGMKTKPRQTQTIDVPKAIHRRFKKFIDDRGFKLGHKAGAILDAYLDHLDAGTDWLEDKASKGDGMV